MRVLMVNKFLYPNGGSETYIFKIGEYFNSHNHEVQYFGMEHEKRQVGNRVESYTGNMDFHTGKLQKMLYPLKIIYSIEAKKKIRKVLDDFQPEVVHLNNINFQITPAIIYEIKKFEKIVDKKIKIIFTAHDYQWVCPNHMMYIENQEKTCYACEGGRFFQCTKNRCIHGSLVKSVLGSIEGYYYQMRKTYGLVDRIICPSQFLYNQLARNSVLKDKLVTMHNFIDKKELERPSGHVELDDTQTECECRCKDIRNPYVLYFGRYSKEKGIETLVKACQLLPEVNFVFAGSGPLEELVNTVGNITNVGFQSGQDLENIIRNARFSIYPSEWYENCPFSVMESQMYGTPVLGANIGGIPELIQEDRSGVLFTSGNLEELRAKIKTLWQDENLCQKLGEKAKEMSFDTVESYCTKLLALYEE